MSDIIWIAMGVGLLALEYLSVPRAYRRGVIDGQCRQMVENRAELQRAAIAQARAEQLAGTERKP